MIFQHFGVLLPYTSIIMPTQKKAQFFFKESDFFSALDSRHFLIKKFEFCFVLLLSEMRIN